MVAVISATNIRQQLRFGLLGYWFFLSLSTSLVATEFHVSPSGNDSNPGTRGKPFATLTRAQTAARLGKGHGRTTIFLHDGTYYLPETLIFTSEDSGTAQAPVEWKAWKNEPPVISGGVRLTLDWKPYRDGIWQASVPDGLTSDQLFVNGQRQILARYPNFDPKVLIFNGFSKDAFSPERAARWSDPRGGFIHAMHTAMWGDFHYLITGKDSQGKITYEGGWQNNRQMGMHDEYRFVENIREELDAAGEWFLDHASNTLYFYPPVGIDLRQATVEVVRLRQLIEWRGTAEQQVKFVSVKGITFRHSARTFMDNREPLLRSDWTTYRGGALFFNGAENCAVEDCLLDQPGGNAVFVNKYNRHVTVRGCHIAQAGASGVAFVGDSESVRDPLYEYNQTLPLDRLDRTSGPRTDNFPQDCLVEDCLIDHSGRVEKQTAPIQINTARRITIRHCSLYGVPRAGINIGVGNFGGHIIEFCDIFDTVRETGDHGSFNSWGRDRYWVPDSHEIDRRVAQDQGLPFLDAGEPNILRNNRWRCDHGWDVDLDDGSSNFEIYNNLFLNGGLKLREGYRRIVSNNILVNNTLHPHVWLLNSGDVFVRNIVMAAYRPAGGLPPGKLGKEVDYNLFACSEADRRRFAGGGCDAHSIVADPQFINPGVGDFRVGHGSAALQLGFKNFPMDQFGVQKSALKKLASEPEIPRVTINLNTVTPEDPVYRWLGATIKNLSGQEYSAVGIPVDRTGIYVVNVPAGSAAANAGFVSNDLILRIGRNGESSVDALEKAISGPSVRVELWRQQKSLKQEMTLPQERPEKLK